MLVEERRSAAHLASAPPARRAALRVHRRDDQEAPLRSIVGARMPLLWSGAFHLRASTATGSRASSSATGASDTGFPVSPSLIMRGSASAPLATAPEAPLVPLLPDAPDAPDEPDAPSLLGAASTAAMLAPYVLAATAAGRGGRGNGGAIGGGSSLVATAEEAAEALSTLPRIANALASMTSRSTGLHYSSSALAASASSSSSFVDLHLNALALYLLRRLRLSRVALPEELSRLGAQWRAALASGLVHTCDESLRVTGSWNDVHTLAVSRLALGAGWDPRTSGASARVRQALSLASLEEGVDRLSAYGKAAFALCLMLPDDPESDADEASAPWLRGVMSGGHSGGRSGGDDGAALRPPLDSRAVAALRYLASSLRVTARSAYLARDLSSWDAAGARDGALALTALSAASALGAPSELAAHLDKLANHVASGGFRGGGLGGLGGGGIGGSSLFDGLALADYDGASGSLAADVRLRVLSGATPIFDARLHSSSSTTTSSLTSDSADASGGGATSPTRIKTLLWSELPPPPSPPLLFVASGVGEASVALTMQFTPFASFASPVYRGIHVAKIIQRFDSLLGRPIGPPLASVPVGCVVTITLQLTTPDELSSLVVEDWLPSGLEPIDPNADSAATGGEGGAVSRGAVGGGGFLRRSQPLWPWLGGCAW